MEQLILRFGASADQPIYWGLWDTEAQQIVASGVLADAGQLGTLHERAGNRTVRVLVDSSAVRMTEVELPPNPSRKVLASIGYMLEDEIASDLDGHFIALGPREGTKQSVAIVSRQLMSQWQEWLSNANFVCDTMLPDVLGLPNTPETLQVLALGDQIIWRHGSWQGMTGEADWMPIALQGYLNQRDDIQTVNGLTPELQTNLKLTVPVTVNEATLELPIHTMASETDNSAFNLLQQEYKVKHQNNEVWSYWRNAAAVLLVAFGLGLTHQGLQYADLKSQNDALKTQIREAIAEDFPGLGSYRDPRRAIARYIQQRENSGAGLSGVNMLGNLGNAFAAGNIKAQTIRFDAKRGEIRMQAVAENFGQLERFKDRATEAGFTVTQGAINNQNNRVIGALIIKG